ncbi:MAG: hypothetical protein IT298_16125 [Chloroflexi bacterium]|nr:hypothetical protein [Chloroflexota bacterium]
MTEEAGFWSSLSYADFARTWNDNSTRPPSFTDPTAELAGDSIVVAGVVSMANPLPGPEDLIGAAILVGGLCLAAVALVAGATAIGLPARQSVNFDKLIGTAHTQPLSRTNATDTHDHILLIKRDLKQAKAAAIEAGVDPSCLNKFSDFLHDEKEVLKGSANERGDYTWDELIDLASEFLQIYPSCTKRGRSSRFVVPPVWDSSREETEFEDARSR